MIRCDNCAQERELCEHRYPSMTLRLCRECSLELVGEWPPERQTAPKTLRGWAYAMLVLALTGCNAIAGLDNALLPAKHKVYREHPGAIRITAERDLIEPTTRAAWRLEKATGLTYLEGELTVRVRVSSVPLNELPEVIAVTDEHPCGTIQMRRLDGDVRSMDVLVDPGVASGERGGCPPTETVILHELLAHVHRAWTGRPSWLEHAESGVGSSPIRRGDDRIDEASLAFICEAAPCTVFNPEEE